MDITTIKNLLKTQIGAEVSDYEIVGLAYAQHYTATNKKTDPEATKIFFDYYGKDIGKSIIACINMIYFGNLAGNTLEAIIKGIKNKNFLNNHAVF